MYENERVLITSLQRINNFGEENKTIIISNQKAKAAFEAIADYIAQLGIEGAARTSANAEKLTQTSFRRIKRSELNSYLVEMAGIARDAAKNNQAFVNKFRIPRQNLNDSAMLETARAFYNDSEAVAEEFKDYGLADDFREELETLIGEFDGTINAQNTALRTRVASNAAIDDLLDKALTGRRTLLVIVPNLFKDNPAKLADWASASYIQQITKKKKTPPIN